MMAKLVTVFGATGMQGGSVAKTLLGNPSYKVRAVTRNPDSAKGQKLKSAGAEVIKADLDDRSSLDAALAGCYGVFGVTNFWEYHNQSREVQQGKYLADAAKAAGVNHVVFSGMENVKAITGIACPHFDGKGQIEDYMLEIGLPYTSVRYPGYMENILTISTPKKGPDGVYYLVQPMADKPHNQIAAAEAGAVIASVFDNPQEFIGKRIGITGDLSTMPEVAETLNKYLSPLKFRPGNMTCEQFGALGFPGAEDLSAMFEFYKSGKAVRDIELTRKLDPNTKSWDQWVAANKDAILAALEK